MPIRKRIPRVVSHESDTSSEGEDEIHSALSSVSSGQLYATPNTELPEIHTSSFSYSSSSEYEDFEDSVLVQQTEVPLNLVNSINSVESEDSIILKHDNHTSIISETETLLISTRTELPNNHERATNEHETSPRRSIEDVNNLPQTSEKVPLINSEKSICPSLCTTINLQVHVSDEDMDISEDESMAHRVTMNQDRLVNNGTITALDIANQQREELVCHLKKCGITSVAAFTKYCILKFDRLHCNFNPSKKRGCQIHFSKDSIYDLAKHLKLYHDIECDINLEVTDSSNILALREEEQNGGKIETQTDNMSVSSTDDLLYNEKIPSEKHADMVDTTSTCNLKKNFIEPIVEIDQSQPISIEEEKQQETMTKEIPKTTAKLKRERRKKRKERPFVSRVTPKVLRNRTTPEQSTPPPRIKSKSNESKAKIRGRPIKNASKTSIVKLDSKTKEYLPDEKSESEDESTSTAESLDATVEACKLVHVDVEIHELSSEKLGSLKELESQNQEETKIHIHDKLSKTNNDTCNSTTAIFETTISEESNQLPLIIEEDISITNQCVSESPSMIEKNTAVLSNEEWPFTLGFGFFTKNKYYCNVNRSFGHLTCCKAIFNDKSTLIQHFSEIHYLNEEKAVKYRENESTQDLEDEIAGFISDSNLLSGTVEDESFKKMTASMRSYQDDSTIIPTSERIRQLLHEQFIKYQERMKQLLRNQKYISFITHVWKPDFDPDNYILIITATYVNSSWNIEEVIVAFHTLSKDKVDSCTVDSIIEAEIIKTIKQLDMQNNYRSICVSNSPISSTKSLDHELRFKISNNTAEETLIPCLDLVIKFTQKLLFSNLEKRLPSFQKISNAYIKSKSLSKRLNEIAFVLRQGFIDDYDESIVLNDIPPLIEKYNLICVSHTSFKKFTLNRDDRSKIKKLIGLNQILKKSLKWLEQAITNNLPTASKALVICMQIMNSLREVAECFKIKNLEEFISESQSKEYVAKYNEEDSIEASLTIVFEIFHKYISSVEKVRKNPLWQALALDTATFAAYDSSTRVSGPVDKLDATTLEISAAYSAHLQSFEIEHMLNEQSISTVLTAPNSPIPMNDTTNISLLGGIELDTSNQDKRKRSDDESTSDDLQPKRKCVEGLIDSKKKFHNHIYQFKKDQFILLTKSGIDYATEKKLENYDLLSSESNLCQIQLWRNIDQEYYPEITELAKKNLFIPVTLKECLRASETIKKYYTGLKYLNPMANQVEIQEKALIYNWRKENRITV